MGIQGPNLACQAEECVSPHEGTGELWVALGHGRINGVGQLVHVVNFTDSQESQERVSMRNRGQGCGRDWIGRSRGRSQGVGCSSLHLLALAWWPPGVASFWSADILGEFPSGVGRSFKPPSHPCRLPEAAVLLNFSLGSCQSFRSSTSHPLQKVPSQMLGYRTKEWHG